MSRTRGGHKFKKELEQSQRYIRRLLKEINRLRATIGVESVESTEDDVEECIESKDDENQCPKCPDGIIKIIDIGPRTLLKCDKCEHRETFKNE